VLVHDGLGIWLAARRLHQGTALSCYLDDGAVPIDNNWCENQIRPLVLGRKNWLFAGSLRSGKRAAAIMSLIQSARLNGHDPYAYLKDVLTQKKSPDQIGALRCSICRFKSSNRG
jgi:hypothetical protein